MSKYEHATIYTRLGLECDHIIEVGKKYPTKFTRSQFSQVTRLGSSSTGDKLRDMEDYGLVQRDDTTFYYTITKIGLAIIAGGVERKSAILAAINNVPLWAQLINSIGRTPSQETFDKTIKGLPQYAHFDRETLNKLWFAYNYDISCLTKEPPYSEWTLKARKPRRKHLQRQEPLIEHNIPIEEEKVEPTEPTVITQTAEQTLQSNDQEKTEEIPSVENNEKITVVSQDLIGLAEYLPSTEKVTFEFGRVRFELKDESSIALAKVLINVKEKGLQRG